MRGRACAVILAIGLSASLSWAAEVGTVTRIVDGDTIKVRIGRKSETVRLIGVDTPESAHPSKSWTRRSRPGGRAERSSSSFNATIRRLAEKRLDELNLSKAARGALDGLSRFHVHMTRHTFACRYLEAGGELAMLQEILGHASVEQTQQYGRPDAKAIRSDADRVFARWEGVRTA